MSEQELIQKKKKKQGTLLYIDFDCLTHDEMVRTLAEIREKIKKLFQHHIGQANHVTPYVVFETILGVKPDFIDIWKRMYWWTIIKRVMSQMRSDGSLFIINKKRYLFVLQTEGEAKEFKEGIDRDIKNLKLTKKRADAWVHEEKWKHV